MVARDLLHGDDNVLEHGVNFEVRVSIKCKAPSMLNQLHQAGYRIVWLGFPKIEPVLL